MTGLEPVDRARAEASRSKSKSREQDSKEHSLHGDGLPRPVSNSVDSQASTMEAPVGGGEQPPANANNAYVPPSPAQVLGGAQAQSGAQPPAAAAAASGAASGAAPPALKPLVGVSGLPAGPAVAGAGAGGSHSNNSGAPLTYVAKISIDPFEDRESYFQDVIIQM
jgi:hypothetical protein